jgi:hypothetical protein
VFKSRCRCMRHRFFHKSAISLMSLMSLMSLISLMLLMLLVPPMI